mmetsp:Transcript_37592/g.116929  ORF Transcript_37592/g.116929 Transcript_37592/m.116929 type:complete len:227 (-) Transcript_37592:401-1081(-)
MAGSKHVQIMKLITLKKKAVLCVTAGHLQVSAASTGAQRYNRAADPCGGRRRDSPRDQQAVLAVDEPPRLLHARARRLVQHALGADFGLHRTLSVPDLAVLARHGSAVEARVQHHHGDPSRLQLFGHQRRGDVAGRAAHVVPVVPALTGVLREAPLHGTGLAGDDDHLAALQEACLVELRCHTQGAQSADVDLLQSLLVVQRGDCLLLLHEVARIVDDVVERCLDL